VRGCLSTPLDGVEGATCRLGQVASPDVCGSGEIDARIEAVIAKRVGSASSLLAKLSQATAGARRRLLGKVSRQLAAVERRVARAESREKVQADCAATLEGLIDSAQALVVGLSG